MTLRFRQPTNTYFDGIQKQQGRGNHISEHLTGARRSRISRTGPQTVFEALVR